MPDLVTHFISLDAGSQAVFLFKRPRRLKEGPTLQYVCERPEINSSVILKKCGGCGRVEELSKLFTVLLHL